jgi:hypothetical protein
MKKSNQRKEENISSGIHQDGGEKKSKDEMRLAQQAQPPSPFQSAR